MAKGSGLRNVLAALERHGSRVRQHGGYYTAQCPSHDDRNASLSISQGTKGSGGAVLTCHARCETITIITDLGLSWPDVFDNAGQMDDRDRQLAADLWMPCQSPKSSGGNDCPGHKAAEYRYTDEDGKLLYAVARCSMKGKGCQGFRQWVPDATKPHGKAWKLPGSIRRVLYRLADVIAAARAGKRIYIMEGEKDADRMKMDFPDEVATTIAAGAGKSKWRPEFARYFKGASEVIIVADCDKTGLEYAGEVHRSVSGVVPKVTVVCTPLMTEGADFSNHRDHGFGLDEFEIVPFEPIKKRPRMAILVEEEHREKPVVFSGFSQDSVERSLVGSMLKYGHAYGMSEIDITTDPRLKVIVKAVARLGAKGFVITPETVAVEVEETGPSTYDKVIGFALELEAVAFSDTAKPLVAARILRERTMRSALSYISRATESAAKDERRPLDQILLESARTSERMAEEYASLEKAYCEPVGDAFTVDVLEEIVLEEVEQPVVTNVRTLRPQKSAVQQKVGQGG
jgi:hypothetical protein